MVAEATVVSTRLPSMSPLTELDVCSILRTRCGPARSSSQAEGSLQPPATSSDLLKGVLTGQGAHCPCVRGRIVRAARTGLDLHSSKYMRSLARLAVSMAAPAVRAPSSAWEAGSSEGRDKRCVDCQLGPTRGHSR